jgi:hypothetical protein
VTSPGGGVEYFDLSPRAKQFEAQEESFEENIQEQIEEGLEPGVLSSKTPSNGKQLGCVSWRAVKGCAPENAERDPEGDQACGEWIGNGDAGE